MAAILSIRQYKPTLKDAITHYPLTIHIRCNDNPCKHKTLNQRFLTSSVLLGIHISRGIFKIQHIIIYRGT